MMDVQLMRLIVDVIDTGSMPAIAKAAADCWNGEGVEYVRSSANHMFRFWQEGQLRYLRLSHASERTPAAIQAEQEFILHLANTGLAVARPIRSANNVYIEALDDEGQRYYAVAFEGIRGKELEVEDLDESIVRMWGRMLALLHQASKTFAHQSARPTLQDEFRAVLATLPPSESATAQVIQAGLEWLETLPKDDYGLIHGDFELDNLIWDGAQFHIVDFDGAMYAGYAADIAFALGDVWLGESKNPTQRIDWFLAGYGDIRRVPKDTRAHIPRYLNLLLAVKIARLVQSYATTTTENAPPWLLTMWNRHQAWLAERRAALKWE